MAYRPPWPTALDTSLHWEVEEAWEHHVGSVLDRLLLVGRKEKARAAKQSKANSRGFVSGAWKTARRLGAEMMDLRGRFRKV